MEAARAWAAVWFAFSARSMVPCMGGFLSWSRVLSLPQFGPEGRFGENYIPLAGSGQGRVWASGRGAALFRRPAFQPVTSPARANMARPNDRISGGGPTMIAN